MRFIFFSLIFLLAIPGHGQQGCPDPQATNYDSAAVENNGSCMYLETNYELQMIAELPPLLKEASGIVLIDTLAWIIVDQAQRNVLYCVDPLTGALRRTVVVENATNKDWEEIAQDETHLYIGDFGNNYGHRDDLAIYKVEKGDLGLDTVVAEVIKFQYEDQDELTTQAVNQTNFDCEAFICIGDSLHLFSKNWLDERTRHYTLSARAGEHTASLRTGFDVEGLITAADLDPSGVLSLLGYTRAGINFVWVLHDYRGTQFFSGNKRRIELGTGLTNGQTEGLGFIHSCYQPEICAEGHMTKPGFIVSEQVELGPFTLPAKLMAFDLGAYFSPLTSTENIAPIDRWTIGPNPFGEKLMVRNRVGEGTADFFLFDPFGQLLLSAHGQNDLVWETVSLPPGFYFLQIKSEEKESIFKLIKY